MKEITMYRADDRSIWKTADEATARDLLIARVAAAMRTLPPLTDAEEKALRSGGAYKQHTKIAVVAARAAILAIYAADKPEAFARYPHWFDPAIEPARNYFSRVVDDQDGPIRDAWTRLRRIDAAGREWEQPYFVDNPNPTAGATAV